MWTKKKITLVAVLVVAIAAVALCLSAFSSKEYDELVPEEAKAVVQIEPGKLPKALQKDNPLATLLGVGTDGLDLSQPLYAFITPNEYIGFCAKVADEGMLKAQFEQLAANKKVQLLDNSNGLDWAWVNDGWLVAWNGRLVFALGPGVAQERDELQHTMAAMYRSGKPFTKTDKFTRLTDQKGAVHLFAQLDAVPAPYNMLFRLTVPADCDPAAVSLFASTEFDESDNGLVTSIESQLTSDNQDVMRAIEDFEKSKPAIDGAGSDGPGHPSLFELYTCTQGKQLLSLLKTDATLRGLLMGINQTVDADKMLGSADGLLMLRIDSLAADWTPSFSITAETRADNLFADADYWLKSAAKQRNVSLNRLSPTDYLLSNDGKQLYFGQNKKENLLYFASEKPRQQGEKAPLMKRSEKSSKDNPDDCLVLFTLDLAKLATQPCMKQGGAAQMLLSLFPGKNSLSFYACRDGKSVILIE